MAGTLSSALLPFGGLVEGVTVELAAEFMRRQWKHNRLKGLSEAKVRRVLRGAAKDVTLALRQELQGVPENEWRAALAAAHDSLEAVSPITITDALAVSLRQENLEDYVRERSVGVRQGAGLSEAGQAVYDHVLATTCAQVLEALIRVPGFDTYVQIETHRDIRDLRTMVEEILERQRREIGVPAAFERRYLHHVVETLGRLELFGVGRGRVPRTHSFEQAYVSLAVARAGGGSPAGEDRDELTGAGVDADKGLTEHTRVLLRGDAGSGKTTLLHWLAVNCSADTPLTAAWGSTVPFFVALREFAADPLPTPETLPSTIAGVIAGEMPPGWATTQFQSGRALLLVDGIDELKPARRHDVRRWLQQMVAAYPGIRVVVSGRPFAIGDDWLDESGFVTFDLQPFSPEAIKNFLRVWHTAAAAEYSSDPEMQEWLALCERRLAKLLESRIELRRLAGNPLLCGLLCALHQDRKMNLPRDRRELYDAALEWLLERWDVERGLQVEGWPLLTQEEQTVLLQRLAYSMVKNHEVVIPSGEAAERIRHFMRGLRSQDAEGDPAAQEDLERKVFQRTLERTGLLREPSPDLVQFVHRTFRDFLAAKEVVASRDFRFLIDHAHLDQWHDVVVNAVAHARPNERSWMLHRLLEGNEAARHSPRLHSRLKLVAAACLPHADVLDVNVLDDAESRRTRRIEPREMRRMVRQAAERLIPPASLDEAEVLARAGSFVLDLLPGPEGLTPHQAACVVRTAAMIGTEGVREKLSEFVGVGGSTVIDELLRAWRRWPDPESYAKTVLADVNFRDLGVEVRGWRRVTCLPYLKHLTNVVCYGDFGDLKPLAAVPRLRRLELVQNESVRDLSPLAGSQTLQTLVLTTGCQFLKDLSPLASTRIDDLDLHLIKADLGTLQGVPLRRLVIRDIRIDDGLTPLPGDLPLRELRVDNLPQRRNLLGVERWQQLEHLTIKGVPRRDEIEALATLPKLSRLTIHEPDAIPGLAGLRALPALERLDVDDVAKPDVEAVRTALHDLRHVDIRINGRPRRRRRNRAA